MKLIRVVFAVLSLVNSCGAVASHFEFCDFEGDITSVAVQPEGTYELVVDVSAVSRAKELGEMSYTDCQEYLGKPIEVAFDVSELPRRPVSGDRILFSRSVVDGFDEKGYVGTSVMTTFVGWGKRNSVLSGL